MTNENVIVNSTEHSSEKCMCRCAIFSKSRGYCAILHFVIVWAHTPPCGGEQHNNNNNNNNITTMVTDDFQNKRKYRRRAANRH